MDMGVDSAAMKLGGEVIDIDFRRLFKMGETLHCLARVEKSGTQVVVHVGERGRAPGSQVGMVFENGRVVLDHFVVLLLLKIHHPEIALGGGVVFFYF